MGQLEKLKAPIQIKIVVYVTDDEKIAKLNLNFRLGRIPSEEQIIKRIKNMKNNELKNLGENWRYMTPEELFNLSIQEKYGATEKYALPISVRDYLYKF